MKEISIAGQGIKALDGRVMSQKHLKRVPTQLPLTFPTIIKSVDSSTSSKESKELKQQSIDMNVSKQDTLKSEIMWCTEDVMCNYSYRSCEKKNDLFASMFSNSNITSQFRLEKTKCAYVILYGIAPYVTDVLNDALQEVPVYSLSFDESYSRVLKKSQMDLLIRYWDERADMVSTRYYDSACLDKAAALMFLKSLIVLLKT